MTNVATAAGPDSRVAERLIAEGLVSVADIAAKLPRVRGKRVSTSSVVRWILRGKPRPSGVKVFLDGCRLAGPGWWTSWPALARFSEALTIARLDTLKAGPRREGGAR